MGRKKDKKMDNTLDFEETKKIEESPIEKSKKERKPDEGALKNDSDLFPGFSQSSQQPELSSTISTERASNEKYSEEEMTSLGWQWDD